MEIIDKVGADVLENKELFDKVVDDIWVLTDTNQDQRVDYKELKEMFNKFSEHYNLPKPRGIHVRLALSAADKDHSGDITKDEFPLLVEYVIKIIEFQFEDDRENSSHYKK